MSGLIPRNYLRLSGEEGRYLIHEWDDTELSPPERRREYALLKDRELYGIISA